MRAVFVELQNPRCVTAGSGNKIHSCFM